MADDSAAPYRPEPVLPARATQEPPLFAPRALTLAELLAETEPPVRKSRRVQTTRAGRSITAPFARVVAAVTRVGGARRTTADTQTVV